MARKPWDLKVYCITVCTPVLVEGLQIIKAWGLKISHISLNYSSEFGLIIYSCMCFCSSGSINTSFVEYDCASDLFSFFSATILWPNTIISLPYGITNYFLCFRLVFLWSGNYIMQSWLALGMTVNQRAPPVHPPWLNWRVRLMFRVMRRGHSPLATGPGVCLETNYIAKSVSANSRKELIELIQIPRKYKLV